MFQAGHEQAMEIMERLSVVSDPIQDGREPDPADVFRLAEDPTTRGELHCVLRFLKRVELFPDEFATPQSLAESDMVRRLCLSDQIGATPAEIEFVETVPDPTGSDNQTYFVFRFRAPESHALAETGWLAGVAGPYSSDAPSEPIAPGTISKLESFESRTPHEHVAYCTE